MPLLDRLAIFTQGIGSGIKESQALQREIAEARRKALIEDRETSVRERQAATEEMYREAQAREAEENILGMRDERNERGRRRNLLQTDIGGPLELDLLGNKVRLPGTLETLSDPNLSDLFARLNEEENRRAGGYYQNVGGGSREPTDFELALKLLDQYMGQPAPLETINPERRGEALLERRTHSLESLPVILESIRRMRSGSAKRDTGFTVPSERGRLLQRGEELDPTSIDTTGTSIYDDEYRRYLKKRQGGGR